MNLVDREIDTGRLYQLIHNDTNNYFDANFRVFTPYYIIGMCDNQIDTQIQQPSKFILKKNRSFNLDF